MQKLIHSLVVLLKELPQILLFLVLAAAVVWLSDWFPKYIGHPEFAPLFTAIYMLVLLILFSHLAQRILFHKINLYSLVQTAATSPVGSGIVVAAMFFVLSIVILCFTLMLH
jgi:hypothetical protein